MTVESGDLVLGALLIERFRAFADRPAVIADGRELTYADLDAESNRLANGLLALGLEPGDRFAFHLPNGHRILSCYLACAKSGIVGVPLAARMTNDELAYQLGDSGATALLYAEEWASSIDAVRPQIDGISHLFCGGASQRDVMLDDLLSAASDDAPGVRLTGDDPFCIMYTGGTTGASKAAVQTQRGWAACLLDTAEQFGLHAEDRHAVVLPMTHAAWFTLGAHLLVGAVTHVLPRWEPAALLELTERDRLTYLHMIPTLLGDLLAATGDQGRVPDVSSVRLLTVAGSPMPLEMYHRARDTFGEVIGNIYGLTEASGPVTYLVPRDMCDARIRSGGRAGRYVEIAVLDEDGEDPELGEIALRGPQITPGYLNRPEETAEAFRDGWFCTGDIGHVDAEGFLYILDRKKDMIKSGGFNVYPKEIEEVLYRHPEVVEAAVIGVPDPKWIESVAAVVSLRRDARSGADELIAHCRSHLAGYKVPKTVHLTPAIPRTQFGKLDKKALSRQFAPPTGTTA